MTKLDGTPSKGGVVIAIKQGLDISIKMLGAGKGIDGLCSFSAREFADAMFAKDNKAVKQVR